MDNCQRRRKYNYRNIFWRKEETICVEQCIWTSSHWYRSTSVVHRVQPSMCVWKMDGNPLRYWNSNVFIKFYNAVYVLKAFILIVMFTLSDVQNTFFCDVGDADIPIFLDFEVQTKNHRNSILVWRQIGRDRVEHEATSRNGTSMVGWTTGMRYTEAERNKLHQNLSSPVNWKSS